MENPDKTDFEKAVLYAMQQLSPLFVGGELKPGQRQPSELFWVIMLQLRGGQDEIGNFYVLREEDDQVLYAMADKDRGAFDLYRKIIADRVDRHALLSLPMKDFHWRLLHDKIKAPKGQTTKAKNFELNLRVVYIADYLADNFALPKFGNSTGPQISVCDAISAAFWRLGDKSKKSRSIQDLLLHKSNDELRKQARFLKVVEVAHPIDHPEKFMKLMEAVEEFDDHDVTKILELLRNARR